MQLADLTARPIGLSVLRPGQANRALDVLEEKFYRDGAVNKQGMGLKVFPQKAEGPPSSPGSPTPIG
jgi:hypothetical protein